ncbi:MAG: pyridoxamine 5'-phosphate oxidase [Verrucomicrobiota bacterium]
MNDPADMRCEYRQAELTKESLLTDPVAQFRLWFEQAQKAELIEPNAMTLATVDADGAPETRTVLLKAYDERGFVFFTNYQSTKAKHIEQNPQVALLFPWLALERQVKILGRAEKISAKESLQYFISRPYKSQIGAWVSDQSSVISSRQILEMKFAELKQKFAEGKVPLPDFWGGYRVVPTKIEFWQGRRSRLHDRLQYSLTGDTWEISRLCP